jgi:mRNA interferase MazF
MATQPHRGDVFWVDFNPTRGSEQAGRRPAVVVSNNVANEFGSVVAVVPITHTIPKKSYPQNVNLPATLLDQEGGTIFCGQILTVSKERLGLFVNQLPIEIMSQVDRALQIHLAL